MKKTTTYLLAFTLAAVFAVPASAQPPVSQITRPDLRPQAVAVHEPSNHIYVADDTTGNLFGRFTAELWTERTVPETRSKRESDRRSIRYPQLR